MPEPYNMVVISAIITFGLVAALFVYRYIFPKKKLKLFFVLILLSLLPLWSILRPGSYESGDLAIHATFAMPFFDSLKEGNVVPIWNSYFLQGNGYPLYAFTYPFPYYAISLFHVAGFSFIDSIKALLIVSFIGSGVGIYAFVKKELQSDISAFTAAVFYLFAPYHLIDMHFRVALGETIAFMILPFCFFMLKNMSKTLSYKNLMGFAFAFGLLILSHQAIALITLPLLLMYAATLYPTNLHQYSFGGNNRVSHNARVFLLSLAMGLLISRTSRGAFIHSWIYPLDWYRPFFIASHKKQRPYIWHIEQVFFFKKYDLP